MTTGPASRPAPPVEAAARAAGVARLLGLRRHPRHLGPLRQRRHAGARDVRRACATTSAATTRSSWRSTSAPHGGAEGDGAARATASRSGCAPTSCWSTGETRGRGRRQPPRRAGCVRQARPRSWRATASSRLEGARRDAAPPIGRRPRPAHRPLGRRPRGRPPPPARERRGRLRATTAIIFVGHRLSRRRSRAAIDYGDALIGPGFIDLDALVRPRHHDPRLRQPAGLAQGPRLAARLPATPARSRCTRARSSPSRSATPSRGCIRNGITTALPIASLFYREWGETSDEFAAAADAAETLGLRVYLGPAYRTGNS